MKCLSAFACSAGVLCIASLIGCDVQKIANMTGGDDTVLKGNNSAIGGVNYDSSHGNFSGWDRHIDACSYSAETRSLRMLSGGQKVVEIAGEGTGRQITAYVPKGAVRFSAAECDGTSVIPTAGQADVTRVSGTLTLTCQRSGDALRGSVRFHACGS